MVSEWEILPCPFCGEQPEMREQSSEKLDGDEVLHYQLACLAGRTRCHTSWYTDESRAVGAWNDREAPSDG